MTGPRLASVALVLAAGLLLVAATTGFSAVSADRPVSVPVADDERAYVAVERVSSTNGSAVTITNHFPAAVTDLDVRVDGTALDAPAALGAGESVTFDLCPAAGAVTVDVRARTWRASAALSRTYDVTCPAPRDAPSGENGTGTDRRAE